MLKEERQIGSRLCRRGPTECPVTHLPCYVWQEFPPLTDSRLVKVPTTDPVTKLSIHRVVNQAVTTWHPRPSREWMHSAAVQFAATLGGLRTLHALPRQQTPAEKEIAKLRELGMPLAAAQLEAAHPPAPPEVIGDATTLFVVNAEAARIGADGMKLLAFGSDEPPPLPRSSRARRRRAAWQLQGRRRAMERRRVVLPAARRSAIRERRGGPRRPRHRQESIPRLPHRRGRPRLRARSDGPRDVQPEPAAAATRPTGSRSRPSSSRADRAGR